MNMDEFLNLLRADNTGILAIGSFFVLPMVTFVIYRQHARNGERIQRERITQANTARIATSQIVASEIFSTNFQKSDPLVEASIYLEYGYYERAAETLHDFVNKSDQADLSILHQLLEIYLQLEQIDNYADILERLCLTKEQPDFLRQALAAGFRKDYGNRKLQVVADTYLDFKGKEVESTIEPLSEDIAIEPMEDAAVQMEEDTFIEDIEKGTIESTEGLNADTPVELMEKLNKEPKTLDVSSENTPGTAPITHTRKNFFLVSGFYPLEPLNDEEKIVLRSFASPSLEAKLYLATNQWENAIPVLHRAISIQPEVVSNYVEILNLLYFRHDIEDYSRTLWKLFSVLGESNNDLKMRLLGIGFSLGHHSILELLAQSREAYQIEAIGKEHGLIPCELATTTKYPLIQVAEKIKQPTTTSPSDDAVLIEVEAYLEYGQIDEAVLLLEKTILENPRQVRLYSHLLNLYDHMDDLERLIRFTLEIKKKIKYPPSEVAPLIVELYKHLKQCAKKTLKD
ncbi:conserved hypothetical protein [Gammaproteobacteria bacterium]